MVSPLSPLVWSAVEDYNIQCDILPCLSEFADTAAFCEKYGFNPSQAANTIIVTSRKVEPNRYVACVVLATTRLDVNKKVCQLLDVKKASFADSETTIALTGMMIGGVTAVGIRDMPIYIDEAVMAQEKIVMGGGNRDSKIVLHPAELCKLPNTQVITGLAIQKG